MIAGAIETRWLLIETRCETRWLLIFLCDEARSIRVTVGRQKRRCDSFTHHSVKAFGTRTERKQNISISPPPHYFSIYSLFGFVFVRSFSPGKF